jgi:hypothetical protein
MSDQTGSTKLPNFKQMLAIAQASTEAKIKANDLQQPSRDREKSFYENGNGHPAAMGVLKKLLKMRGQSELKANDALSHIQQVTDELQKLWKEKGHAGNLDDMARKVTPAEAVKGMVEPPAPPPGTGALSPEAALAAFRKNEHKAPKPEAEQPAEAEAKSDAADEGAPKKRGRPAKPKLEVVNNNPSPEPVAPLDDEDEFDRAAPPVPPAARVDEAPGTFSRVG